MSSRAVQVQVPRTPSASRMLSRDGIVWIEIAGRTIPVGGRIPEVRDGERLVRCTSSICLECLRLLPAVTVLKTVNDHELGDIIWFAGKHIDVVGGVNF